jgi:hypothetical protein
MAAGYYLQRPTIDISPTASFRRGPPTPSAAASDRCQSAPRYRCRWSAPEQLSRDGVDFRLVAVDLRQRLRPRSSRRYPAPCPRRANGTPCAPNSFVNPSRPACSIEGRLRRFSPIALRSGECLLTERTAGVQPRPQERVLMPHKGHFCGETLAFALGGELRSPGPSRAEVCVAAALRVS